MSKGVSIEGVGVAIGQRQILSEINLHVEQGSTLAIVGPNGSGKSTLLRVIYRALRPDRGRVRIDGTDVWRVGVRLAAQLRAVVPQHQPSSSGLLVRDIVASGRHASRRWYEPTTAADREAVDRALHRCGADEWAGRPFANLSGGERQRVLLARALAQQAPTLLLDEPTNHLDLRAQHELLSLVAELPLTRILVLHDLDLAVAYADRVAVLHRGRLRAVGEPGEALREEVVAEVFGLESALVPHPLDGRNHFVARLPDVPL